VSRGPCRDAPSIAKLLRGHKEFLTAIPKAKTAKLVRTLIDRVGQVHGSNALQAELLDESIAWCKAEQRNFLRIRLQTRLAGLLLAQEKFHDALILAQALLREIKKLDDKPLLVEIHVLESRIHHQLHNVPKARAALTSARAAANSIYLAPETQADIDLQAGTLAAEDEDYNTASSYFFEAYEAHGSLKQRSMASKCLKYMVLSKIMTGSSEDALALLNGKQGIQYAGPAVEAMRAIVAAYSDRSLSAFQEALKDYKVEIVDDEFISRHLQRLYDRMLEGNLARLVEPFSRVELEHVAKLIALPVAQVETKLSQMILDGRLSGTLDQGRGQLVLFEDSMEDETYDAALGVIDKLGVVVDGLFAKSQKLR
jgi:26S proteasome regulatory subunit N6